MNGMKGRELTKACHLQGNVKHIKLELRQVSYEWIDGLGLGHVSHCFLLRNAS